jgi:hypothetical protein
MGTRRGPVKDAIALSIVIAVVSGKEALRRCLNALRPQVHPADTEIIVPYDQWSIEVGELAPEFPDVRFHLIEGSGGTARGAQPPRAHQLYDRRRAVGLSLARGRLVAMTEDHAVPAPDWCRQIVTVHEQPHAVIGGAIDNAVDRPLNWALYYCDFGRFGRPLPNGEAAYASDVNVAYKRGALEAIREVWRDAYHETTVNWTLRSRGEVVFLDSRLVVHQHRPAISLGQAYRERIEWGRTFAETRVARCGVWRGLLYAAGTPVLPVILLIRVLRHMLRQRRAFRQMATTLPLALFLLTGWALGEFIGYVGVRHPDKCLSPLPGREPSRVEPQGLGVGYQYRQSELGRCVHPSAGPRAADPHVSFPGHQRLGGVGRAA